MQLRWPWVTKAERSIEQLATQLLEGRTERLNHLYDALDEARRDIREQREYNRTLVQLLVDMRREGFASTPGAPTAQPRSPRANVEEAIRLAAGGDKGHASVLRAWVASKRAEGSDEDAIAKELLQPVPAESDGVPA